MVYHLVYPPSTYYKICLHINYLGRIDHMNWCALREFHSYAMQHNWLHSSYSLRYAYVWHCQYARYVSQFVLHLQIHPMHEPLGVCTYIYIRSVTDGVLWMLTTLMNHRELYRVITIIRVNCLQKLYESVWIRNDDPN